MKEFQLVKDNEREEFFLLIFSVCRTWTTSVILWKYQSITKGLYEIMTIEMYTMKSDHISRNPEMPPHLPRGMRRLLREMWMWVQGMRISKGDRTSPMGNNCISGKRCRVTHWRFGISRGRFARISKSQDMWHYSLNHSCSIILLNLITIFFNLKRCPLGVYSTSIYFQFSWITRTSL